MVIGEREGAEEFLFGDIRSLEVGGDGTVFVLDVHVPIVRVFDSDGRHLRNIGQEGSGPGEYKSPDGMAILPDGRVLVRDPPNGRITVYDTGGRFLEQWPLTGGFNTERRFYVDHQGRSYANTILERGVDPWDWTYGLVVYSSEGEILDTIPAPTWDMGRPQLTASDENSSTARWVPFHPMPTWTFSPLGYMVGGLPTEYRIDLHTSDPWMLSIEKDQAPVPVLAAEAEERRQAMTRNLRRRFPGWSWNGPSIPDEKPPFKEIFASREGNIWVSLSTEGAPRMTEREAGEEEQATGTRPLRYFESMAFDVFEPSGRYLGRIKPPESFRMEPEPFVREEHVWAVTRDELDIPRVARFRIAVPEEAGAPAETPEEPDYSAIQAQARQRNQEVAENFRRENQDRLPVSADEVLARHLEAIGGAQAFDTIQTMVLRFTAHGTSGTLGELIRYHKKPLHYRQEGMGSPRAGVTDGQRFWWAGPDGWEAADEPGYMILASMDNYTVDPGRTGIRHELVGVGALDNDPGYEVLRIWPHGREDLLFFSAVSGLLTAVRSPYPLMAQSWFSYWDYRDLGGLHLPFVHIRSIGDLGPPHGLVLKSVEINVPLPDSLFLPPEERG
jgi:hypothetical protein